MTDLRSLNVEESAKKVDNMPASIKDFLSTNPFIQEFNDLVEEYGLLETLDEPIILQQLTLLLVGGVFQQGELASQIEKALSLPKGDSKKLADDLVQILDPALKNDQSTSRQSPIAAKSIQDMDLPTFPTETHLMIEKGLPKSVVPVKTKPTAVDSLRIASEDRRNDKEPGTAPSSTPRNDTPATPSEKPTPAPAPFIIHDRNEVKAEIPKPIRPVQGFDASRPTFIKPQFGPLRDTSFAPPAARIQVGNQIIGAKKDLPTPKVVNYSAASPAQPTPKIADLSSKKPTSQKSTDPNTIDLRDLPK